MPNKKRRKKRKKRQQHSIVLLTIITILLTLLLFRNVIQRNNADNNVYYGKSIGPNPSLKNSILQDNCFFAHGEFKDYQAGNVTGQIGVDISSHQGWIDWESVATEIDFAIIRAGYRGYEDGHIKTDSSFEENIGSALAAGLDVGIYFFSQATSEEEAREEARFVVDLLKGYDISYPVYFDWEPVNEENSRSATISTSLLTSCAVAFCNEIEAYGYQAGIYFNLSQAYSSFNMVELRNYSFWLAEYAEIPSFPYKINCWQYSCDGTCTGIEGKVDLNLFFKEY